MENKDSSLDLIAGLIDEVSQLKEKTTKIISTLKTIQKELKKEKKITVKKVSKTPSGFAKKGKISDELCEFMNLSKESEVARTEVTKFIIQYIKNHELEDEKNKQNINPDESLKTLLQVGDNERLTYFNIQKKMNIHFIKS